LDRLPFAPTHRSGEPPTAYASRLAAAYGLKAKELCHDQGIGFLRLLQGEEAPIAKLAYLGSARSADLQASAFVRHGQFEIRHRAQAFRRENLVLDRLDVCPRCLLDDIARGSPAATDTATFLRAEWCLDAVDTCAVHGRALVTLHVGRGPAYGFDFANVLTPQIERLGEMAKQAEPRAPTGLQTYMLARLDGRETDAPYLDAMTAFAAIRTCEMLGAAACFGGRVQSDRLDRARLREARAAGFDIASSGESAIHRLLENLTAAYLGTRPQNDPAARLAFAALHNFLLVFPTRRTWKDDAFTTLRATVRDFINANFPLKPGETVLGEPVAETRVHSTATLAKEVGAGVLRVRKLLQIAGVIGPDTPNNAVFDAQAGYRAVRDDLAALSFRGAAKHLGINLKQARLFAEAGLIEPVAESPLRLRARFAPAALDAFLAKLLAGATPVRRKGPDHTAIPETSLRTSCQQTEIVELILAGKLKWIGCLGGKRDFTSILVKLSEVDAAIHGLDPDTLSVAEFAKQACLKKQAAQILVKRGIVASITRKRAGHQVGRVPRGEVDAFRRRYVTLGELSRNRRKHHAAVQKSLEAEGILPAFDLGKARARVYRREEAERKTL
jgi:TniQ